MNKVLDQRSEGRRFDSQPGHFGLFLGKTVNSTLPQFTQLWIGDLAQRAEWLCDCLNLRAPEWLPRLHAPQGVEMVQRVNKPAGE